MEIACAASDNCLLIRVAYMKRYCTTLNIRGVNFLRYFENDKLAHFNFGVHDIPWIKVVKKI